MSKENSDLDSRDLWNRAKTILMASLHSEDERSQAERYFSNVTSVSSNGPDFTISTGSSFAADLLKGKYLEDIKKSVVLAGGEHCDGGHRKGDHFHAFFHGVIVLF